MAQRVLIVENDEIFAQELTTGFKKKGFAVDIANDGPTGLERASEMIPDLILLTIELQGMNGFLVCKKIKKTESLKDIPLIILSSEASNETFEQHSKLRTHAQLYLHKPISFEDVLSNVNKLIEIDENVEEEELDAIEEVMEIEDEMIVISEDGISESNIPSEEATYIVDDAEKFANDTFESLMSEQDEQDKETEKDISIAAFEREPDYHQVDVSSGQASEDPLQQSTEESVESVLVEESDETSLAQEDNDEELIFSSAGRPDTSIDNEDVEQLRVQLENAQTQIVDLKKMLKSNEPSSQAHVSASSDRDLLNLKEQLNRKERELISLKDQVSARDKQLLESSDENLRIARELADLKDSYLVMERETSQNREGVAALKAEKDAAQNRIDDLMARIQKLEAKSRELEDSLDNAERNAAEKIEHIEVEYNEKIEEAQKVHEEEIRSLREELEIKHASEMKSVEEKHSKELAVVVRSISEAESRLTEAEDKNQQIEGQLKRAEKDNSRLRESLDASELDKREQLIQIESLSKRLGAVTEKIENDKELLQRVHKAIAIGIGLLEEQKQNSAEYDAAAQG